MVLSLYLVGTEIPAAEDGDAHHVPGPRDGASDRVTQEMEGIGGREAAVRAVQQVRGHRLGVQGVHLLYPSNFVKAWRLEYKGE